MSLSYESTRKLNPPIHEAATIGEVLTVKIDPNNLSQRKWSMDHLILKNICRMNEAN